jgi:hypothetical protein
MRRALPAASAPFFATDQNDPLSPWVITAIVILLGVAVAVGQQ